MNAQMRKLSRIAVAIGGFLVMMEMIMIGTFALALFKVLDVGVFMDKTHLLMLMLALLLIGVLDIMAGFLLLQGVNKSIEVRATISRIIGMMQSAIGVWPLFSPLFFIIIC